MAAVARDGTEAVDAALEAFPPTTEQILHPERWPDEPTPVEPLDPFEGLADAGTGWRDLDVMQVGELWLRELLQLRIDDEVAGDAAAGWDGGAYRAWIGPGDAVVVTLRTAWDSAADARAFAEAIEAWIAAGDTLGRVVEVDGTTVDVATDERTLDLAGAGLP